MLSVAVFAFLKIYHGFALNMFLGLITNNKYTIVFHKGEKNEIFFTFLLFVVQCVSLTIVTYFIFQNALFKMPSQFWSVPLAWAIFIFLLSFSLLKIFLQYIIIYVFDIQHFGKAYLFEKITYSNYAGFALLLSSFMVIYGGNRNIYGLYVSVALFVCIMFLGMFSFFKKNQQRLKPHLFYFILYLCTFEIAPYVLIGYCIKNIG